jgi:hypothetical protein
MKKTSTIYRSCKHPLKNLLKADLAHFNIDLYAKVEAKEYISFPLPSAFVVKHRKAIAEYILAEAQKEGVPTLEYMCEHSFLSEAPLGFMNILWHSQQMSQKDAEDLCDYVISEVRAALNEAVRLERVTAEVKAVAAANRKDNARMMRRLNHA